MISASPEQLAHWRAVVRRVSDGYVLAHGRRPSIFNPRLYSEKMQWRKLFELDPRFSILCDKLAVRDFVAGRVGAQHLIPLLWSGTDPASIPFGDLAPPYVLKSTHAAGHTIVVRNLADVDPAAMRRAAANWLTYCHGKTIHEPGYVNVPRRLMVERLLFGPGAAASVEYKVFVFDGRARVILSLDVAADRISRQAAFHAPDWAPLGWSMTRVPGQATVLPKPAKLDEVIGLAETLGRDFSHVRVDLYECAEAIRVGELTLYTWSGYEPYRPAGVDRILGDFWRIPHSASRALWTIANARHVIPAPD